MNNMCCSISARNAHMMCKSSRVSRLRSAFAQKQCASLHPTPSFTRLRIHFRALSHQKRLSSQYNTTTTATMIPANFNTATLFPCPAMVVSLLALPFRLPAMVEKVSEVLSMTCWSRA